jgi:hypothetical protein
LETLPTTLNGEKTFEGLAVTAFKAVLLSTFLLLVVSTEEGIL